jgi:hypothetical protein
MEWFKRQSTEILCGEDPSAGVSVGCLSQHTSSPRPTAVQQSASICGFFSSLPPDVPVCCQFPLSCYIQQHFRSPSDVFLSLLWSSHRSSSMEFSFQCVCWYSRIIHLDYMTSLLQSLNLIYFTLSDPSCNFNNLYSHV